ncbi:MAG: thiamine diphosphokinase, partial [Armatimonadota bacterium]
GALAAGAEARLRAAAALPGAFVVAVDGGGRHLLRMGIDPHWVTGDFDSLTEPERTLLQVRGARIVATPDQDHTDLDKAIALLRAERGARRIAVYGATGGRIDHLYSVLSTLVRHGGAVDVRLVDEVGETFVVAAGAGETVLRGDDLPGRTVSLMALGAVEGVTTRGVRWPLSGEALAPGVRDGTLNVVTADEVGIRVEGGSLLVLLHHARAPFQVRPVETAAEFQGVVDLRWHVLRPGRPRSTAHLPGDDAPGTVHYVALDGDERVVGCATVLYGDAAQLRGMAVDVHWQGKGVGAEIVRAVMEHCRGKRLWCNARLSAAGFYRRCGFMEEGDVFEIEGIGPHVRMAWHA